MDSFLGMFCALAIFLAAYKILKEAVMKMLGEELDKDLTEKLRNEIIDVVGTDIRAHHFHLHDYVLQKELTLHIELYKNMTIEEGHHIASIIEEMVKAKFYMSATVHVEPLRE
jgi:divalent metal cation (Fe/Co/Zn/Cd) transporter